jgi:hypothetical protein
MSAITNITPTTASQLQALPTGIPVAADGAVITPEHHNSLRSAVGLIAHSFTKIAAGETAAGAGWTAYLGGTSGIQIDVDTSGGQFTATPIYLACIGGISGHWSTTGGSAIYLPTATSFRIYLRWDDGGTITPAMASSSQWHIKWIGIQP